MVTKLEVYLIALVVVLLGDGGFYVLGRWQESKAISARQNAADVKELHSILQDVTTLRDRDAAARQGTNAYLTNLDRGLADVAAKYSKLPSVVVDARGCPDVSPAWRMRWNATADLPAGSALDGGAGPAAGLPAAPVPPAR